MVKILSIHTYISCTKSLPGKLKHLSFLVCFCSFNQHLEQYQKFDAIHTQSHCNRSSFISHLSCDLKKSKPTIGLSKSSKQTISWTALIIYGWFRTTNIISQGKARSELNGSTRYFITFSMP